MIKIIASWVILDVLEGIRKKRYFIDISCKKGTKQFTYRNPFGIYIRYRYQVDDHNNWRHAPISLYMTWATNFFPDRNFYCYLGVSEVNTDLVSGHFQNDWMVQPSMHFWRALVIDFLENKILVELGDNGQPSRTSKIPMYVPCEQIKVKHHGEMWDPSKKEGEK